MPPRTRKTAPAPAAAETLLESDPPVEPDHAEPKRSAPTKQAPPPICEVCFPAGWPDREDAYAAGCEHGSWLHPQRAAAIRS